MLIMWMERDPVVDFPFRTDTFCIRNNFMPDYYLHTRAAISAPSNTGRARMSPEMSAKYGWVFTSTVNTTLFATKRAMRAPKNTKTLWRDPRPDDSEIYPSIRAGSRVRSLRRGELLRYLCANGLPFRCLVFPLFRILE